MDTVCDSETEGLLGKRRSEVSCRLMVTQPLYCRLSGLLKRQIFSTSVTLLVVHRSAIPEFRIQRGLQITKASDNQGPKK